MSDVLYVLYMNNPTRVDRIYRYNRNPTTDNGRWCGTFIISFSECIIVTFRL